jgi:hypothetical protein
VANVRTGDNKRESWWVKNLTKKTITIGDLLLLPAIKPGKKVDLLHYYTREKISHSTVLVSLVKARIVSLNKKKLFPNSFVGEVPVADIDDAITPAEENEVGEGGGGTGVHNELSGLQGGAVGNYFHILEDDADLVLRLGEDSSGLTLDGIPVDTNADLTSYWNTSDFIMDDIDNWNTAYSNMIVTNATGAELNTLTDGVLSNADLLHFHSGAGATHNGLLGIQGGTTNQYYHLTEDEIIIVSKFDTDPSSGLLIWDGQPIEGGTEVHNELSGLNVGDYWHLTEYINDIVIKFDTDPSSGQLFWDGQPIEGGTTNSYFPAGW